VGLWKLLGRSFRRGPTPSQRTREDGPPANGIESFWSSLKRGIGGTYVAVEPFHLDRYVDEQVFRYDNRAAADNPMNDFDRFSLAVTNIVGKRLTYAELTGKEGETVF
jgi:hypothetical protein